MLNQPNKMIMKKTMKGMLGILLVSMVMFSCKKEDPPVADFQADATDVFTGAVVTFTDLSTNNPTTWDWDFGDQGTSTMQNPTHTYTEAGVYTVSLTTTNEGGSNTATKTDYITVTVEQTEAEKLVEYMEDPTSPTANYVNTSMPAIKDAAHVYSLQILDKVYIIDIRAAADYDAGHIEGAVNVPAADVLTHIEGVDLTPYDEVSIVCYTGQTAAWATSLLRLLGYDKVYSMKFGMCAWHSDFSDRWNNNTSNIRAAQFEVTNNPKGAAGDLPAISTGGTTPQDILEARVEAVLADGFGEAAVGSSTVFGALSNYYIVNYWPEAEYLDPGHIPGAIQYTPKVDIAMAANLSTLPTDKTIAVYCYTGQNSANLAAYLRVIGYDAKSITFGTNGMIYDLMTKSKWNGALVTADPPGQVFDYPYVLTTK
jgi:PKD repeat protein